MHVLYRPADLGMADPLIFHSPTQIAPERGQIRTLNDQCQVGTEMDLWLGSDRVEKPISS